MTPSTRRAFVAGAALGAGVPFLTRAGVALAEDTGPPATAPRARQLVVRRGRALAVSPHGDRLVVAHDQRRSVAILSGPTRRVVDVGGQPVDVAISRDGRRAVVTTASWDHPALVLLDLRSGAVRGRVDVGPAPAAAAFTPDGRRVLVCGGDQEGHVMVVDVHRLAVVASRPVGLNPRAIAVAPGGDRAWVTLEGDASIVAVATADARVHRTLAVPALPGRLALAPDGTHLLVTHGGHGVRDVSEVTLATGRVRHRTAGDQACAVGYTSRGRPVVALTGAAELVVLGPHGARRVPVPGAPRALALAGRHAWTVDGLTGDVHRVTL